MLKYAACICVGFVLSVYVVIPVGVGTYYNFTGDHDSEQQWLNREINYLKFERSLCQDAEKCEALDYVINKYDRIGGFCVMVAPLPAYGDTKIVGCNYPWIPGLVIDPVVLRMGIKDGAYVLLHESQHDWLPYGHPWVDAKMKRLGCL